MQIFEWCVEIDRLTGRVHNLSHTFLTAAFAQEKSSRGRVGQDVATNWFSAVSAGEEGVGARVTLHLVGLREYR